MPRRISPTGSPQPAAPAAPARPAEPAEPPRGPTSATWSSTTGTHAPGEGDGFGRSGSQAAADAAARAAVTATASRGGAVFDVSDPDAPRDTALARAFSGEAPLPVQRGAKGDPVVALQYGLARVGFTPGTVDGDYGPATERTVRAFQANARLPQTGVFDRATLAALDARLAATDLRTPAERSGDPLAYLSDHAALGMAKLPRIADRSRPVDWNHPEIQKAYGAFVGAYWEHLKANKVECDCKTLSLFFMDQFRGKVKADLGVQLPRPGTLAPSRWEATTPSSPGGFFGRFEALPTVRPGYERAQAIQRLDPQASMIAGVNLRYAGVDANMTSRGLRVSQPWTAEHDNRGDARVPEVAVQSLLPGDVIFIDHTGDGRVDHMANVIGVDRDDAGRVLRVRVATGSFDDMKDADGSTAPRTLGEVNNYTEEVTISFGADGKVESSKVTWSSEPAWLTDGRYAARTLLMELRPNGTISVGRWAQPD